MNRSYYLIAFLFFINYSVTGQDLLGARTGNYSGVSGISLNPASMVDSKLKFDLNIGTGAFNFDNNYIYFSKDSLTFFGLKNLVDKASNNGFSDDYHYNGTDKYGYVGFFVQGPSAMLNLGRSSVAFSLNSRAIFNVDKVHFAMAKLAYEDLDFDPLENDFRGTNPDLIFNAKRFTINTLAWSEWCGSYGTTLYKNNRHHIKGGLTLKYLQGLGGGYLRNNDINFYMHGGLDDTTMTVDVNNLEYGRVDYWSYADIKKYKDMVHGKGFGWDLGFIYEHSKKNADKYMYKMDGKMYDDPESNKYDFRIGASLTDFGSINFKDQYSGTFRIDGTSNLYSDSLFGARNFDWFHEEHESQMDFDTTYSRLFFGDPNHTHVSNSFRMTLPAALNITGDINIWKKFFVNVTITKFLKRGTNQVTRPNLYSITPRFESRNFEMSIPLSYYNENDKRLGLYLRVGSVFFGSDFIGSLLGFTDVYGVDIYTGLKWSINKKRIKDRDKDFVSDKKDKCLNSPGVWAFKGCPDTDNDGIPDSEDQCINYAGLPDMHGCPDKDKDGITDKIDECPDDFGSAALKGCPDTDGDSIIDKKDDCPTTFGLAYYRGCPDTDRDSIIDKQDECPLFAGPVVFNGCPDTDKDSIPDHKDDCPLIHGMAVFNGCPDTDKDGIPDRVDDCPLEFGTRSNKGCPVKIVEAPKRQVVEEPMPEVKKVELTKEEEEIINKVFKNLNFETNKSIIKPSSFESLNNLAELLKKKTNFKLLIEGHTDNVGKPAANLTLSKNRAAAAEKYLTDRGIDEKRIYSKGYGLTKPVATNKTPEGRAQNRRVEFTIVE